MKKCTITVFISVLLIFLTDIIVYSIDYRNLNRQIFGLNQKSEKIGLKELIPYKKFKYNLYPKKYGIKNLLQQKFREPLNTNSNLEPIYIFGCSYAYGTLLNNQENFGAVISKITNRPVYHGWGIQHAIGLLENYDFSKLKQPKYVIYVYITDHIRRLKLKWLNDNIDNSDYFRFSIKNGNFYVDSSHFPSLYLYRKLHLYMYSKNLLEEKCKEKNFLLLEKYISRLNFLVNQKFPNSKFIFFVYDDWNFYDWNRIQEKGLNIIEKKNLSKDYEKYDKRLPDTHPSAEAWAYYTPLFVKAAGIK